jgi:hypothetical protein
LKIKNRKIATAKMLSPLVDSASASGFDEGDPSQTHYSNLTEYSQRTDVVNIHDITSWTVDEVGLWLKELKCGKYIQTFKGFFLNKTTNFPLRCLTCLFNHCLSYLLFSFFSIRKWHFGIGIVAFDISTFF